MELPDDVHTGPRADLVAALRAAHPQDATLCEGWQARHLAAHVVLRERRPVHVALDKIYPLSTLEDVADEAVDSQAYARLVDQVEQGPSVASPMGWFAITNVLEFHVHAQDVRRGHTLPAAPVLLPEGLSAALWTSTRAMATMRYCSAAARGGSGLILVSPTARAVIARGPRSVVLRGTAIELALWVSGRERASLAALEGHEQAIEDFLLAHSALPEQLRERN